MARLIWPSRDRVSAEESVRCEQRLIYPPFERSWRQFVIKIIEFSRQGGGHCWTVVSICNLGRGGGGGAGGVFDLTESFDLTYSAYLERAFRATCTGVAVNFYQS